MFRLNEALAAASFVWAGVVIGIGTEARVKFYAKSLTRPVALDVGRHVFTASEHLQAAIAAGMASGLFIVHQRGRPLASPLLRSTAMGFAAVAGILGIQMLALRPKLVARAEEVISESITRPQAEPRTASGIVGRHGESAVSAVVGTATGNAKDGRMASTHVGYIVLDGLKIVGLLGLGRNLMRLAV